MHVQTYHLALHDFRPLFIAPFKSRYQKVVHRGVSVLTTETQTVPQNKSNNTLKQVKASVRDKQGLVFIFPFFFDFGFTFCALSFRETAKACCFASNCVSHYRVGLFCRITCFDFNNKNKSLWAFLATKGQLINFCFVTFQKEE